MDKNLLIEYLNCRRLPLSQHEGATQLHSALCEIAPDFYLRLLADPVSDVSHKREVLTNLLNPATHEVARQSILELLYEMPLNEALRVISVIRDERVNRSRARELLLSFLIGHEQFPALAATKRQRVIRLLKHALGERTWSSVKRSLASNTVEGEAFLQRMVLRYARHDDHTRARETLNFLAGVSFTPDDPLLKKSLAARKNIDQGEGLPGETLLGLRGIYHQKVPVKKIIYLSAVKNTATRQDGPLTAMYKGALSGQTPQTPEATKEAAPEAKQGLLARLADTFSALVAREAVNAETPAHAEPLEIELLTKALEALPQVEGRLGIVLDLSGSMDASGERLHHPLALALVLVRLLRERVREVVFAQVGGSSSLEQDALPLPEGATDIATSCVEVARQNPQAIFVITDGFENIRPGDTEQVVRGLRQLGLAMPIYQVVPLFSAFEQLAQRRLGESIPLIPVLHEEGVHELLAHALLATSAAVLSAQELTQLQQLLFAR